MIDRVARVARIPRAGETVAASSTQTHAGGKGANQAVAAAMDGARVRMLGRTGVEGQFIKDAMRSVGVDVSAISTTDVVSGSATVIVAATGENAIVIASEANSRIAFSDVEQFLAAAVAGESVLLQNECALLAETIALAGSKSLRVWLNAAPADVSLRALHLGTLAGLIVNETEAEALTGVADPRDALEVLASLVPSGIVIITLGAQGAIAASGSARDVHRGFVVEAVDTVGCGDAFVGVFLASLAAGSDITHALARANAAGALCAMECGAIAAMATRAEIDAVCVLAEGARVAARQRARRRMEAAAQRDTCAACGYNIQGKPIGERCSECGTRILPSAPRKPWVEARSLARVARGALVTQLATIPVLLVLIIHGVDAAFSSSMLGGWSALSIMPRVLMVTLALQVVGEAIGTALLTVATLHPMQQRVLRIAMIVRLAIFSIPVLSLIADGIGVRITITGSLGIVLIPALTICAIVLDVAVMRILHRLATETEVTRNWFLTQLGRFARASMWFVLFGAPFPQATVGISVVIVWNLALIVTHMELRAAVLCALRREQRTR